MKPKINLEKCIFCKKKGIIEYEGMDFCGKEHLALYKEKMKLAKKELSGIKVCSTCGKVIKWKGVTLTGSHVNGKFKVFKFCNGKCFENMPDFKRP
jgi:hypothetical protein